MPYIVISVIFAVIAFVLLGMVKIGNGVIWRLNKKQIIAPFFLLIILIGCFKTVPTGHTGIITTFGKVEDRTLDAGVHFLAPWKTVVNMDNRTQKQTLTMNCFSSDIQEVSVVYTINYSIEKSNAQNIYKNIGIDYFNTVVLPKASEALKSVFAKYTAENLVSARGDLSTSIEEILVRNVSGYHINVEATSIEDIDFTDAFTTAVEEKQVAQQNKLKAETEAEKLVIEAQAAGLPCFISDVITSEVIITEHCEQLPLKDTALWANAIENAYGFVRRNDAQAVKNAGYDIDTTTAWIQHFYLSVSNTLCKDNKDRRFKEKGELI